MRDWFVFHCVSGHAFFTGFGLLGIAWVLSERSTTRLLKLIRRWSILLGLTAIGISGTPMPIGLTVVFMALLVLWLWQIRRRVSSANSTEHAASVVINTSTQRLIRWLVLLSWLACLLVELPYHLTPNWDDHSNQRWAVIGDSLSSEFGVGPPWPGHLERDYGMSIRNLAVAGATARTAMKQAVQLDAAEMVLIEIGGNDLLRDLTAADFEPAMEELLRTVARPGRRVVMFELPVPPWGHRYGAIQRRLASRFNVTLIPKRVLAGVLTTPGATTDGLHFTQRGYADLAKRMAAMRTVLVGYQ